MSEGIFLFNHKYELADTIETEKLTENYMDAVLNGIITGGFTTTEYKDFDKYDYFGVKEDNNFWLFKIRSVIKDNDLIRVSGIHIMFDELQGVVIRDKRPQNRRANEVLNMILEDTDWKVGTVVVSASFSGNFYHQSTLSALYELASKSTCEFRPVIKFNDGKIISKEIQLYDRLSDDYGKLFAYGDNLISVVAETNTDELFTAFIGRGKGEEIHDKNGASTGGYGRKIKFDTIDYKNTKDGISVHSPVGQDYIEITQATKMYGYPNGKPRMTEVSFDNIEDRKELADATFDYALENCRPKVQLKASGLQYETVELGEIVTIIGKLDIRYKTRVFKIKKDFLREKIVSFEFGDKLIKSMSDRIKQGQISEKEREITEQNYIKAMIEMVESSYFNEDGYQYDLKAGNEYGLPAGIYSFNRPIDQNPTKVIYLGAGKLMIANSKKSDGSWKFSVAIDGDAVNANVIRAGLLKGGRVEWDLQNGTFLIGKDKEDFSFYWDGKTLKLRNVDLDLKNNYEFKEIKTEIDNSIAGVNSDLKTYVDDKDNAIDSRIDSVSQSLTLAEGKLDSRISAVRTETYKDINGIKTNLSDNYDTKSQVNDKISSADSSLRTFVSKNYSSITQTDQKISSRVASVKTEINTNLTNNYDTKSQVDAKIKSADTSVRSYVEKNYSTITQTDSKISSKVASEIKAVNERMDSKDSSLRSYVSSNYSTKTQTSSLIDSKISSFRTDFSGNYYTKTQTDSRISQTASSIETKITSINSRLGTAESNIKQTASEISTKVSKNGIISTINQSPESIKIKASRVDLQGDLNLTGEFKTYNGYGKAVHLHDQELDFYQSYKDSTKLGTLGIIENFGGPSDYRLDLRHDKKSAISISYQWGNNSYQPYIMFDHFKQATSDGPTPYLKDISIYTSVGIRDSLYVWDDLHTSNAEISNDINIHGSGKIKGNLNVDTAIFTDTIYCGDRIKAGGLIQGEQFWTGDWVIKQNYNGELIFYGGGTHDALSIYPYSKDGGVGMGNWRIYEDNAGDLAFRYMGTSTYYYFKKDLKNTKGL